jgi:hypothetical protein
MLMKMILHGAGTIWAHPGGSDGSNGKCGSHGHIMQGGSVGDGLFGIGGIRPNFLRGEVPTDADTKHARTLLLAPVPWIPDAPRGAAVWRSSAGFASTSWATQNDHESPEWSVWVNATVPVETGISEIHVMVPPASQNDDVCAWECGFGHAATGFKSQWISFDSSSSTGHRRLTADVPSEAAASAPQIESPACTVVWRAGAPSRQPIGVESVAWKSARAGSTMYPALAVTVGSGSYAFFARSC